MTFWSLWRHESAHREQACAWRAAGALDDPAWQRVQHLLGPSPSVRAWRGFLEHLSLWLAAVLLGAALICFIAANWDQLGRSARLYGLQLALVVAAVAAWRLRIDRAPGKAALLLAGVLLGGLLALLGQTYQTGADTWQLFALWAALLVPWTVAGASLPMGLLWVAVANIALFLYTGETAREAVTPWWILGMFNLALFAAWQWLGGRFADLRGRTGPRLLACAALACASTAALIDILESPVALLPGLGAWALTAGALAASAWRWRRDLVVVALVALSIIVVDTCLVARALFELADADTGLFLVLAVLVIGQASAASALLRRLASSGTTP